MTVKECYEQIGANYTDVIERLGSETLVQKFAQRFLADKSYENLKDALQKQEEQEAFRASHTLKGICLNLGFDGLYKASSELTELLRGGSMEGAEELFERVKEQYDKTVGAIERID